MCRLSAITTSALDPVMRRLFFHQVMLTSNADHQYDGNGFTDGTVVYKTASPFMHYGGEWLRHLDESKIWIGHVRSASQKTGHTTREAHPFVFMLPNGEQLMAAHNGFISGMEKPTPMEPQLDSYQAFKLFLPLLEKHNYVFTPALIDEWTALFGAGSEYAFMFSWRDTLHIVRGIRTMYALPILDGCIFNTSQPVLLHIKEWIQRYWQTRYELGKIEEIKPHQLVSITMGQRTFTAQSIAAPVLPPDILNKYYVWENGAEHYNKQ